MEMGVDWMLTSMREEYPKTLQLMWDTTSQEVLPVQILRQILLRLIMFPPPFTRNFIPRKPDLTFLDEIVESENMDVTTVVTPSNVKTVESNLKSAGVKIMVLLRVPRKDNIYSVDLKSVVPTKGLTCLFAKATIDESNLWHRRLGHINFKNMNKLMRGNLVRGLPSKIFENDHSCVACQKGKQHKASCKAKLVNSISKPLHMLHMDLFGPTNVKSLMKKSYCLVVTDDFSRFSWVFFLATKDETSGILKTFITEIENQLDHKVKVIRCDNGTEFKNSVMNQFCEMKGIKREFMAARLLAEYYQPFWAEAVNTACYVLNRVLVIKPHNKTPYELIRGRTPLIDFMKPFGCPVTILNTRDHLGKPDWLFDVDSLTISMNYVPVVAGNQTNGIAGTRDNIVTGQAEKKTKPEQEYILIPICITDPLISQDPKVSEEDAEEKPTEMDENGASDKDGKDDQATRSEFERLLQQEKQTVHPNSTNSINTVSTPVSAAGPSFTNDDPSSPVNAAEASNAFEEHLFERFSPFKNAFTLPPVSNVTPMDDTGIFGNAYDDEDVGADADLNNLETTMNVSPIPTTRIDKDHPKDQIIGDFNSAIQTRRMTKISDEHAMMDVKSAFLYGTIEEEVYVCQPLGFEDPKFLDKVYKVEKALYGLHQAPKAWSSIRFTINKKKVSLDVDILRDILHFCLKIPIQVFEDLLLEQDILSFIRDLRHTREITYLTDVNVDYLHQPWRAFATEELLFQIQNKDAKKTNKMSYPRFTKIIIDYFMSKDQFISRRNKMFWHTARDYSMFTSMRCISRHKDTQVYGTILPIELTNQAMLESKAYQTYYAFASGVKAPKPKYIRKKADSDTSPKKKPVQATKGTRLKSKAKVAKPDKKKQPAKKTKAKGLAVLSEVALSKAEQLKLATKRSKKDFHMSHASGLGDGVDIQSKVPDEQQQKASDTDEGTGTIPGVPDVPTYESKSEKESWGDSKEEDDNDDGDNDDDGDSDDHDDDNDNERIEYDRDEIPDLNMTNVDQTEHEEEEYDDEFYEEEDEETMYDDEDDEVTKELYEDVDVNLGNVDTKNADQGA
ncbi:putative ribonuclease H-like domain-containing protein [Tanacetum coccineum]